MSSEVWAGSRSTAARQIEDSWIGIDLHRQAEIRVPHEFHSFAGRYPRLAEKGAIRVSEGMKIGPAAVHVLPRDFSQLQILLVKSHSWRCGKDSIVIAGLAAEVSKFFSQVLPQWERIRPP
jgi:hypothetical protein